MKTPAADPVMLALSYPFERFGLDWPDDGRILLVNAVPCAGPWSADRGTAWQWWKGLADSFAANGYTVAAADAPSGPFSAALVRLPRQRDEAQYVMATAHAALDVGGLFVVAAANDDGVVRHSFT